MDGRYRSKLEKLAPYFSEFGYIRYKLKVEAEYFIALAESGLPPLAKVGSEQIAAVRQISDSFSMEDALRVKEIEKVTNHDVKAVEYLLKERFEKADEALAETREFIHFGLTSQDINNTSVPMMLRDALQEVLIPAYNEVVTRLEYLATEWENIPMLARTHGQPASPTRLDKEIRVFSARLSNQLNLLNQLSFPAKFGGATGNFNAHYIAFPDQDWHAFANKFVGEQLGLSRSFPTTQIEHYDGLGAIFDNIKRINTILLDLCQDIWLYVSSEYFRQKTVKHEVGSSAMPHKVNPIDFENGEGNLGFGNAVLEYLSRKLPVSRLQRDLTDSTVLRNIGVGVSHSFLAAQSILKGLGKLEVNRDKIRAELENNWAVVSEAIQTILRREGYPKPYEALKDLTRGNHKIDAEAIATFIEGLDVSEAIKAEMRAVTPWNYLGR